MLRDAAGTTREMSKAEARPGGDDADAPVWDWATWGCSQLSINPVVF